jgi:hypothetical protein
MWVSNSSQRLKNMLWRQMYVSITKHQQLYEHPIVRYMHVKRSVTMSVSNITNG